MASLRSKMSRSARKAAKHDLNIKIFHLVESLGPPGQAIAEKKREVIEQKIGEIEAAFEKIRTEYRDDGDKKMAFETHIERCLEILKPMASETKLKAGRTQPINEDKSYNGRTGLLLRVYHSEKRIGTHGGKEQALKKLMDAIEKDDKEINKEFRWNWPARDKMKMDKHEQNVKEHMEEHLRSDCTVKKTRALPTFGEGVRVNMGDRNQPMNG